MDCTGKLSIEQKTYPKNRKAINRIERLSIDQNGYRQNRIAIDRAE